MRPVVACPGCREPMALRSTLTLEDAETQIPALAEHAHARGITEGAWHLFGCDYCDCGCRRIIPVPHDVQAGR